MVRAELRSGWRWLALRASFCPLGKNFNYMGVLGSQAKADKLKQNLLDAHFTIEQVAKFNMPIGLKIKSQTPMEIAVSIAAEIISLKP